MRRATEGHWLTLTLIAYRGGILASTNKVVCGKRRQSGVVLLAVLTLLTIFGLHLLLGRLAAKQLPAATEQNAAVAMAEAKTALIGDAIARVPLAQAGYLRLPDLGAPQEGGEAAEGSVPELNFTGNAKDVSVIGKFPWKTLDTGPLPGPPGDCLWYVVSGRFKKNPPTDTLNWDTPGQIDIKDATGRVLASNLAALLVAPGGPLDGQNRTRADAAYAECGGNYDARNYLDAFDHANAIADAVNYFAATTKHRFASSVQNKVFVVASTDHYNDRFLYVTVDDVFNPLIRRRDFALAVNDLIDNPTFRQHLQGIAVSGSKGTDNIACGAAPDPDFCRNWKEMLFLAQLSEPSRIVVEGVQSPLVCRRVLIFAGRKTAGQHRQSAAEKADKSNYLEGSNPSAFSVISIPATTFSGNAGGFNAASPSTDLVRCLS